jgi:hypothetical protein
MKTIIVQRGLLGCFDAMLRFLPIFRLRCHVYGRCSDQLLRSETGFARRAITIVALC